MSANNVDYGSVGLSDPEVDSQFEKELSRLRAGSAPIEKALIDGADAGDGTGPSFVRFDPCDATVQAGGAYVTTDDELELALMSGQRASRAWRKFPYTERTGMLERAANGIQERAVEIAAVITAETGKTRLEAIGEVNEAVDLIRYYCAEMTENNGFTRQLESTEKDDTTDVLRPYGLFAVIAPFNFPVALSVGMMSAALIGGNTVLLKPSSKTPRSTSTVGRILSEELPAGVLNIVFGSVGDQIADAEQVDGIAFTGSADVGWSILRKAAARRRPIPVLAEMGGQNPVIVTPSADLEAAATGIVRSAYGLSGQKCSSTRRVVVIGEDTSQRLLPLLKQKIDLLEVGDPLDATNFLGPVIDDHMGALLEEAMETARRDGELITGGRVHDLPGNFFRPILITGLRPRHPLTRGEIFGPLLTYTTVSSLDEAIEEANDVDFGLTAGIFSGDDDDVEQFLDEIEAGVTYVNHDSGATTGAWPGQQSFCGWKLSGATGKGGLAGWYLPQFMREQSRTIRRGGVAQP